MFWKRKQKDPIVTCADRLYAALKGAVTQGGRIRVEELISAAAALVGEAALAKAGDFNPRQHDLAPGSRVLSTKLNALICDDKALQEAPVESIIGDLRDRLLANGFEPADFPVLKDVFVYYVLNIGKKEQWGWVPLSIPQDHHPAVPPLRIAHECRPIVDRSLAPLGDDTGKRLRATTAVLARALCETRNVLVRHIALSLAIETVNGMAKTVPMTEAALTKLRQAAKTAQQQ
jgi:hypothetical protein